MPRKTTPTIPDAHRCGKGREHHRWELIPIVYEPNLWYDSYVDLINEECMWCHKIAATMWDDQGRKLPRKYKHKTGNVWTEELQPPTDDDYRRYQLDKARQLRAEPTRLAAVA